jgi:hypothetical protein
MGVRSDGSTHSQPRQQMDISGQTHAATVLPLGKTALVPIKQETVQVTESLGTL